MDNQIFFHIFNDFKAESEIKKIIKISNIVIFSIFFSIIFNLLHNLCLLNNNTIITANNITSFSLNLALILGFMAYISTLSYYNNNKNEDFFLMSLIYMNLFVELLVTKGNNLVIFDEFIFVHSIFRIIILFYIAFKKDNRNNIISKNKVVVSILVFIFSIIVPIINNEFLLMNIFIDKFYYYAILMIIIVILYIVACLFISKKSLKNSELIYTFIVASMLLISLRGVYWIYEVLFPNLSLIESNKNLVLLTTIFSFILAICSIFIEISNKNKGLLLLQKELQVFYHLVEFNTNSSIILYDDCGQVIYTNKKIRQNYCSDSSLKNQLKEVTKLFDDAIFMDGNTKEIILDKIFKDGNWEGKVILKNKKIINIYVQTLKVEGKNYYALNLKDITEEFVLSQNIKKNEQLLTCINNNIQDLIISVDTKGIITYVNHSVLKTLNYSYDEIYKLPIRNLLGKNDEIVNQLKSEDDDNIKCKLIGKHAVVYVEAIISSLNDDHGIPYGKLIVAKNLNSKRKLENLAVKFKKAKASEQVKNEFFANISHELRTPLNIIYSTIQLLNSKYLNSPTEFYNFYGKYKKGLKINCYRMLRLVNNLIDVTKIEVGFLKADFTNKDIVPLVENITSLVIPHAENKNISIIFDTNIEENIIKCDPVKLERAILNLLSNAIKFTPANGEIFVDLTIEEEWVKLSIKDTGIGIPIEMQASIFDRFVQADKSLKRRNEGSGIGLSIVKSITELHDGKIELISNGVCGTEFIIWLPNVKLDYTEDSTNLVDYITDKKNIELELSDIYEVN